MVVQRRTNVSHGNGLVHHMERARCDEVLRKAVDEVRPRIDTKAPGVVSELPSLPRVQSDAKKQAAKASAMADLHMIGNIAREMCRPPSLSKLERKGPASLNVGTRRRELTRIDSENDRMLRRLETVRSDLGPRKHQKSYDESRKHVALGSAQAQFERQAIRRNVGDARSPAPKVGSRSASCGSLGVRSPESPPLAHEMQNPRVTDRVVDCFELVDDGTAVATLRKQHAEPVEKRQPDTGSRDRQMDATREVLSALVAEVAVSPSKASAGDRPVDGLAPFGAGAAVTDAVLASEPIDKCLAASGAEMSLREECDERNAGFGDVHSGIVSGGTDSDADPAHRPHSSRSEVAGAIEGAAAFVSCMDAAVASASTAAVPDSIRRAGDCPGPLELSVGSDTSPLGNAPSDSVTDGARANVSAELVGPELMEPAEVEARLPAEPVQSAATEDAEADAADDENESDGYEEDDFEDDFEEESDAECDACQSGGDKTESDDAPTGASRGEESDNVFVAAGSVNGDDADSDSEREPSECSEPSEGSVNISGDLQQDILSVHDSDED